MLREALSEVAWSGLVRVIVGWLVHCGMPELFGAPAV